MGKRSSQLKKQQRLDLVGLLLGSGHTTSKIIEILMNQYPIGERQAFRYLAEVRSTAPCIPTEFVNTTQLRYLTVYRQAMMDKDFGTAIKALDGLTKLGSQITKGVSTHEPSGPTGLSPELAELVSQLASEIDAP